MALISGNELNSAIKFARFSGVYYLYGKDIATVMNYKNMLIKKLFDKDNADYNLHSFFGKNFDLDDFSNAVETLPMFADYVVCVVNDLNAESLPADRLSALIEVLSDIPETTIVIFYNSNIDVTDGKRFPTAKNKKLIDYITKVGSVANFAYKTPDVLAKEIITKAQKSGLEIERSNARIIAENCGCNSLLIEKELEKIISFTATGTITKETIDELCVKTIDATIFDLSNAVARNDRRKCFKLMSDLKQENVEPIPIIYAISNSLLDLYRAKLAITHGKTAKDVLADFSYAKNLSFRIDNAIRDARNYSLPHLRKCIDIIAKTDVAMKSLKTDNMILLEEAIIKMLS